MDWDSPTTPQSFNLFYLILKCYDWLKTIKYLLLKVLHCSGLAASLCSINIVCVITKLTVPDHLRGSVENKPLL